MGGLLPRSLLAKSVLAALVPIALILVAVGVGGVYTLERFARDVVRDRDEELARVAASRPDEQFELPRRLLRDVAGSPGMRSGDPARIEAALDAAQGPLFPFDGGVLVYDRDGVLVTARPPELAQQPQWLSYPDRSQLEQLEATLRPVFSGVLVDPTTQEDVVLFAVPVLDESNEFAGSLTGILTLWLSLLGTLFTDVLGDEPGAEQSLLLVDERGRVIFHPDVRRIGESLRDFGPVARVIAGESGAEVSRDPSGQQVVSGYAPVPGTGWGIVTQERWELILGPIRDTNRLLLLLLAAGGVLTGALVFLAVSRVLRPIGELTEAAQRLAGGEFDAPIEPARDGELRELAEQFNTMAAALRGLYEDLERRVEARTAENRQLLEDAQRRAELLAALNLRAASVSDVATQVSTVRTLDELLPYVVELLCTRFGFYHVDIHLLDAEAGELVLHADAGQRLTDPDAPDRIPADRGIVGWVAQHGQPLLANDVRTEPRFHTAEHLPDTRSELAVPIMAGAEVLGVLNAEASEVGAFDGRDQFTLRTLADQLAVAIENARLFEQTGELAVLEERTRMAREMHDTLAQGFTGVILQLEAAEHAAETQDALDELREHLERAKELARESLQEARRSVWDLLPRALEECSLDAALAAEVQTFDVAGRERGRFDLRGRTRELPSTVQAALLRIGQESLTNVRRHAAANEVVVELSYEADYVRLRIQDDGGGFEVSQARSRGRDGGFGLQGMEQRARQLGGSLELSGSAEGTVVEAMIPAR